MDIIEKIKDVLMFREGTELSDAGNEQPVITSGSIIWGVLLRTFLVIISSSIILSFSSRLDWRDYWWAALIVLWFFAAYPAWIQFNNFQKSMEDFTQGTLCGSCRYFIPESQLCSIYDEHPTKEHIPCEGESWEPKP